jgi:thiol-disulfide isomerase/thioredoxin
VSPASHRRPLISALTLAPALVLALAAAAPGAVRADREPPSPAASPLDFTATRLDGSELTGASLAGKAVLLDFWGTWCAPCIHAFPELRRIHADFGDRLTVVGLAFYSGELEDIAAVAAEHELDYVVAAGREEMLDQFEVFAFPTYVMISAAGEVVFAHSGEASDLYARVAAALGDG